MLFSTGSIKNHTEQQLHGLQINLLTIYSVTFVEHFFMWAYYHTCSSQYDEIQSYLVFGSHIVYTGNLEYKNNDPWIYD